MRENELCANRAGLFAHAQAVPALTLASSQPLTTKTTVRITGHLHDFAQGRTGSRPHLGE